MRAERLRQHWEENAGGYGWVALGLGVVALDVALPQTLSAFADKMLEHDSRLARGIPWAIGGVVAGHVLNVIPEQYDPIQRGVEYASVRFFDAEPPIEKTL